jgi:hypothetical protein
MRGSVGGITYTANQWYAIIGRARVSPVNPSTPNQSAIRSALAAASSVWKNLADATREAWSDYAATCQYQGPIEPYYVTGRLMFTACLSFVQYLDVRGLYDFSPLPTAPTVPGFFSPGPINIETPLTPGTGISLSIGNSTGENGIAFIERSYAFNVSRERFKGPFLSSSGQCVECDTGTTTFVDIMDLEEGYVYFTRVRLVTAEAPFRLSAEYIFRHIAETVVLAGNPGEKGVVKVITNLVSKKEEINLVTPAPASKAKAKVASSE